MKTYIINLDRRPDRLERMETICRNLGISFERIAAVDGMDIQLQSRAANLPKGFLGWKIGPFVLACFESHRLAWKALVSTGEAFALILEDDMVLSQELPVFIRADWIPEDADLVRLETFLQEARFSRAAVGTIHGRVLYRLRSRMHGAGAYIVSRKAASFLLRATDGICDPVDEVLFNEKSPIFRRLRIYQVVPAPAIQGRLVEDGGSEKWVASSLEDARGDDFANTTKPHGIRGTWLWKVVRGYRYRIERMVADLQYARRDVPYQ